MEEEKHPMCGMFDKCWKIFWVAICLPCIFVAIVIGSYFWALVFKAAYISVRDNVNYKVPWEYIGFWNPFDDLTVWFGIISFLGIMVLLALGCLVWYFYCGRRHEGGEHHHHHYHIRTRKKKDVEEEMGLMKPEEQVGSKKD